MWTDFIQVIIMLIGALYLMIVSEFTELSSFIASSLDIVCFHDIVLL